MKKKGLIISMAATLILCVAIMLIGNVIGAETAADRLRAVCDGFSMGGLLVLCVGGLVWISGSGSFDILGYACKRAAHMFIPGKGINGKKERMPSYFEYKLEKSEKRKQNGGLELLVSGAIFFVVGVVLILVWYQV